MSQEERRQDPRIELNRPVPVRLPNGDSRDDIVKTVSLSGLTLECDVATADTIVPAGESIDPSDPPVVSLEVSLPVAGDNVPMEMSCRVRYRIAGPGGKVNIGLEFKDVRTENLRGFWQFIEESLLPG
ncbi:MAG: PilZ domain-containing protein [Gammaproteobacteria bacterium]|nr:PilZ domain-containing protein [Gammaproteobacteria bacterium]